MKKNFVFGLRWLLAILLALPTLFVLAVVWFGRVDVADRIDNLYIGLGIFILIPLLLLLGSFRLVGWNGKKIGKIFSQATKAATLAYFGIFLLMLLMLRFPDMVCTGDATGNWTCVEEGGVHLVNPFAGVTSYGYLTVGIMLLIGAGMLAFAVREVLGIRSILDPQVEFKPLGGRWILGLVLVVFLLVIAWLIPMPIPSN